MLCFLVLNQSQGGVYVWAFSGAAGWSYGLLFAPFWLPFVPYLLGSTLMAPLSWHENPALKFIALSAGLELVIGIATFLLILRCLRRSKIPTDGNLRLS
ncbi:MAG: hypothetical protein ABI039_05225 [Vicinamibacterales bacterium]